MTKRAPRIRKGQAQAKLTRDEVVERFRARFYDPKYAAEHAALERMEEIAWQAYRQGRKAPLTRPAGPSFADPKYEISVEWLETRAKLKRDWMAEIYERFTLAHGILVVTPVYWHQVPSTLKLMMDRLVCADGGNPDPSSTHGKTPAEAKAIELRGWDYPQHLADRVFGIVTHGDAAGAETVRRSLVDWLEDMGLVSAGPKSHIDRYVGYYEPYATSHDALDDDRALMSEVRGVADAVANAVRAMRKGELSRPDRHVTDPRPK